jgi:tetratricopeptide (TPR) repeat protein
VPADLGRRLMADTGGIAAAVTAAGPRAWLDAFTGEGFEVERERTWEPAEQHRGGLPDALEVPVATDEIAFALVVDEETDAVFLLPPDPGTEREALGVARFSLVTEADDRGVIGLVAQVLLKGPGRKIVNVLTGQVARAAAARWEGRARPEGARLFRPRDPVEGEPMTPDTWSRLSRGPSLLWLHGPFAQTHTGFAGLDPELWGALADRYQGRLWAYDHHTISAGPRANARDLLRLVSESGAGPLVVDVIAHSRGGLVARELAERSRDTPLTVRSLIMAGTPNQGTPLADTRGMVAGLNRFTNLLTLAPDPISDITGAVVAVVTQVLGDAIGDLPGLSAMAPPAKNPSYLGELNGLPPAKDVTYRLLAGDYQPRADGSRLGKVFANWAVDTLLKDDANDLVVPASSALGGDRIAEGTGVTVTGVPHTGFWRSAAVAEHLQDWLLGGRTVTLAPPPPSLGSAEATPSVVSPDPSDEAHPAAVVKAPSVRPHDDAAARLEVGVRHASLEHAPYALVVGHFAGAPLSGSEARLDDRLGGRLTRLALLNQYPRALGESLLLTPVDEDTPRGVLILGLGPSGELTGTQLSAVVTRALLRLANQHLEHLLAGASTVFPPAADDITRLGVSAVPIGTSAGGGLTVEGCVRALVAGVSTANDRLRRLMVPSGGSEPVPATTYVRFDRLELIERYADRVDLLADALDRLDQQADTDQEDGTTTRIRYMPSPEVGEGASTANPPLDPGADVWRRLGISALGQPSTPEGSGSGTLQLEFTSMGRLARAERLVSDIEPSVVDPILDRAISRHSDPSVSATLYELLVPHLLKGELNDGENLHILVDRTTAVYPWELLTGRAEDSNPELPLALRVGMLRQFRDAQDPRNDIRRAAADTVLVVGNPPPGPGFAPLPGAAAEAQAVDQLFRDRGWASGLETLVWDEHGERIAGPTPTVDQAPGEEVLNRFLNGDWRIVHMAAHGEMTTDEATTGLVIGGQFHLTAKVFASLSVVPDLVFLNACHIGEIPNRDLTGLNKVAASVAESLLRIGVRVVIAAGWAVNDQAAKAFATTLYSELLDGRHLGEAAFAARRAAKDTAKSSLTWGAYQCYGDPGFRLVARHIASRRRLPQTAGELRRRIQRLGAAASDQGRTPDPNPAAAAANVSAQLRTYRCLAIRMRSVGALADLGEVHAELGQYDRAALLHRRALRRGGREVPLRAMEQTGNMLIRWAHGRVRRGRNTFDQVRPRVEEAERWLRQALAVGPTDERWSLLGGFHKRYATMARGEERIDRLRLAIESYAKAERLYDDGYQRNNWVQLYHLLGMLDVPSDPAWVQQYAVSAAISEREPGEGPVLVLSTPAGDTFGHPRVAEELRWQRFERGDRVLTAGLVKGRLDVDRLVRTYRAGFRLRSSARERGSVIEHLDDLLELVPPTNPLHDDLASAIAQLRQPDSRRFFRP